MSIASRGVGLFGIGVVVAGLWLAERSLGADGLVEERSPAANGERLRPLDEPAAKADGEGLMSLLPGNPSGRLWARGDYLFWWTSGMRLPALVTTDLQGTPSNLAGVLPGATILFGDQTVNGDGRSGYRTTLGMWLDTCQTWDVQVDYLALGERTTAFNQQSNGDPILAGPFYNVQTGQQASQLVAYTGLVSGAISIDARERFQSAGVLFGRKLLASDSCGPCQDSWGHRIDLLAGVRYYNLGDSLSIYDERRITQTGPLQNTMFFIRDNFRANNDFYGGDLGFRTHIDSGRWSLELLTKVALGNTHQSVTIGGHTIVTATNQPTQQYDAGILAVGTNSGTFHRDDFTMIPELGLEIGYQVTRNWRAFVGYNLVYWAPVSRAANQIDPNLDPRNFPPAQPGGTPLPVFTSNASPFWAQGVNFGAEFRF